MGRMMNGGGDQLARGAAKATFRQPDVSEEKYNAAFEGFDADRFMGREPAKKETKKKKTRKSK